MSEKYAVTIKKNDDLIFELETDNIQVSHQREVTPLYRVGCLDPWMLKKGPKKTIITIEK